MRAASSVDAIVGFGQRAGVYEQEVHMAIRAIVFDIGGVLEVTPPTNWEAAWEARLNLQPGAINAQLRDVWRAGSIGTISEADVEQQVGGVPGSRPFRCERYGSASCQTRYTTISSTWRKTTAGAHAVNASTVV